MPLEFRPYQMPDRDGCLSIFTSNSPLYFRDHEQRDFEDFIDSARCPYFVVEQTECIIGCGGFGLRAGSAVADLCWGMVARTHHRHGIGEFLLLGRLAAIIANEDVERVRLATSQHTEGFYENYGFRVQTRQPNGVADGLDNVEMQLDLPSTTKERIVARWQSLLAESTKNH